MVLTRVIGQDVNEYLEESLKQNDISKKLPPLDTLIKRAQENSAKIIFFDEDIKFKHQEKKRAKIKWMDLFSVGASYSYGIFDNLNNQQLAGDPNASQILLSTEQSRYSFNAGVNIPLATFFKRKIDIKGAQADIEKAKLSKQVAEQEVMEQVIQRYYNVILAHDNFLIANTILDTHKIRAIKSKIDYENGVIGYNEFNTSNQLLNEAIKTKSSRKVDLILALRYLENIVGFEIII